MTAQLKLWLSLAGLAVLAGGYVGWRQHERQVGELEIRLASAESVATALTHRADSIQAAYRVDTVRLTKLVTKAETTLTRLIDTALVIHTDTVKVPVTVLVQADSTIKACRIVLSDCEHGWDTEKALNASLRAELAIAKGKVPSTVGNVLRAVLWGGVGFLAGRATAK